MTPRKRYESRSCLAALPASLILPATPAQQLNLALTGDPDNYDNYDDINRRDIEETE